MGRTRLNVEVNLDDFIDQKDNITIIPGFQTYVDNERTSYLIINWKKSMIYSYVGVKKFLDSSDKKASTETSKYENTYSFSELMGIGFEYRYKNPKSSYSNHSYFKETISNLDKGEQWRESKIFNEIEQINNFPYGYDISAENLVSIILYLRFDKNTHSSSSCDEILYIFDARYCLDDNSESILHYLKLSEKYENALKNVIYNASGIPHTHDLNNLVNGLQKTGSGSLSTEKKLSNLLEYYLNEDINMEEFIRRKNVILKNITEEQIY